MVKPYWLSSGSYWRGHSSTLLSVRLPGVIVRVSISIICLSFFIRCFDSILYFSHAYMSCTAVWRAATLLGQLSSFFPICVTVSSTFGWGCTCQNHQYYIVRGFSINMVGPDLVEWKSIVWYFVGFVGVSSSTWMRMQSPNDVVPSLVQLAHSSSARPCRRDSVDNHLR